MSLSMRNSEASLIIFISSLISGAISNLNKEKKTLFWLHDADGMK